MQEIAPGIFHWTAFHEGIRQRVHSYLVSDAPVTLVDPMLPEGGLEWFEQREAPEHILLTNRHHYRHSARFVERFGCVVRCQRSGLHEFEDGRSVEPFDFGDELSPLITALEVDSICSEDAALHIRAGQGALAFADALVRAPDGALGFVPDPLIGDDPDAVKRGVRSALARLLEREFDSLLFAHGEPLVGGGKAALRQFVDSDG